jgi:hypothetical protein
MYAPLFFILAPFITGYLLWLASSRYRLEPLNRGGIMVVTLIALAIWAWASRLMLMYDFGMAWGLAHARPPRPGPFPEGWLIYAYTASYAVLGMGLAVFVRRVPTKPK